jgi:D-alanyl-D-alanine carboxypeptidase (penicillin-binding protein 5/6)
MLSVLLIFTILISCPTRVCATVREMAFDTEDALTQTVASEDALSLATPSAILLESSTGTILYEKNSHEQMRPASITKIMTLILIFEALESGSISKEDVVTVSEHAASMGGSQVFLEAGEEQTVNDLIKCISIASANDACVAMAEYIGGTEEAFVQKMNEKAKELGMSDTNFVNCCGLEADGHLTSAYDIALMSMELINKHPDIFNYCTIWMDTIYHTTRKGTTEFGLTNTNKLLRYYSYTTGLKTGYTSQSKYCISATASKDDLNLIAVVMAEETAKLRNAEAVTLFNYGFSNCSVYTDENTDVLPDVTVSHGTKAAVPVSYASEFRTVLTTGMDAAAITKNIVMDEPAAAPLKKGDVVGYAVYLLDGKQLGTVDLVCGEDVEELTFGIALGKLLRMYLFVPSNHTEQVEALAAETVRT